MAIIPGSGAIITPIFNSTLGVDNVIVEDGGSGYVATNPPKLRITNCGIPTEAAILKPIIKNGSIIRVDVLNPGYGYDPLRIEVSGTNPVSLGEGQPYGAQGKVFLKKDLEGNTLDEIEYVQLTSQGDSYFDTTTALIRGGGGQGATAVPITGFVTGLSILNPGREYLPNNTTVTINGGGGAGAKGVVGVDEFGIVSNVRIENPGEFYETDPLVLLVGGGGSGAKASASINLGELDSIQIIDPGGKYTSAPEVVLARQSKLIRKVKNRQIYSSVVKQLSGLVKDVQPSDSSIFVESTTAFSGSGSLFLNKEIINYTGKTNNSFTGCNRGINFRYDQKVILDVGADNQFGFSGYKFSVSDRVNRTTPNASNKIAKVYDWNPITKALYITFEVDALAFIDAGRANEKSNVIAFSGGISGSAITEPHVIVDPSSGDFITILTEPIGILQDVKFQDDYIGEVTATSQPFVGGDGFADIYNDETAFEGETYLNGGNSASLYGIEETTGGQNTTLFETGDVIRDSSSPPLEASIVEVTGLTDGERHISLSKLTVKPTNSTSWVINETMSGQSSAIQSTVVFYRIITNGLWETSGQMQTNSRLLILSNTLDLEEGMVVAGDVIPNNTSILKIINSTVVELSQPVGSIIGNTTRPVVIKMNPAPIELETNPLYTKTENYLYVKSPVFPNPIIQYEYQILETITGTNGAIAKVANLEYFQLVKDETQ
jgi:hypothetical protein